jgi:hypothetical protein
VPFRRNRTIPVPFHRIPVIPADSGAIPSGIRSFLRIPVPFRRNPAELPDSGQNLWGTEKYRWNVPHEFHPISMWIPCGKMDSMWIPCGFHVIPCGFHVERWIPCGIHMESPTTHIRIIEIIVQINTKTVVVMI